MIHFDLLADIALTRIKNPTAKIILLTIARYVNGCGECFPSRETISHESCVPIRSVVRAIQWLEDEGYIRIIRRSGTSNFYVITSMEDDMTDDTRANLAHEVDSNITKLDFSKKNTAKSNTTSRANLAHPLDTPFFIAFWQAYPRRIGKGDARTAFSKATAKADPNMIVQAALAYANHVMAEGTEQKFIPHAATWLNGERWEDDLETEKVERKSKTGWGSIFDEL